MVSLDLNRLLYADIRKNTIVNRLINNGSFALCLYYTDKNPDHVRMDNKL